MLVEGCLGNGKRGSYIAHACVSKALGAEEKKGRIQNKGESVPLHGIILVTVRLLCQEGRIATDSCALSS